MVESPTIPILFQDDHLVAVNKPGNLLVHRTELARDRVVLLRLVREQIGRFLFPVHRLDRAASGAMIFALSSESARELQTALAREDTVKEYLVLVRGSTPDEWYSDRPLSGSSGAKKPCKTSFKKVFEFSRMSLLEATLHSGRKHQIRRHLAHAAHQVIGDTTYGKGKINRELREQHGLPRLFLHARRLSFRHPHTGERVTFSAPLADDLRTFLATFDDLAPSQCARI